MFGSIRILLADEWIGIKMEIHTKINIQTLLSKPLFVQLQFSLEPIKGSKLQKFVLSYHYNKLEDLLLKPVEKGRQTSQK